MPLLILPIIWIAAAAGRRIHSLVLKGKPAGVWPIEWTLFGLATGLGLLAYGVLAIGLMRILTPAPVIAWIAILAVIGWSEHAALAQDLAGGLRRIRLSPVGWLIALVFAGCAAVSLIGCFTPPTMLEWDSMSYHLADPKMYLQWHRVLYLPWESHSNFAFTMEMLYTIGLMAHSVPLAKLFNFVLGVAGVIATYLIGARAVSKTVGTVAALIFASLPIVMWEAGTAYVDLAATTFGALGLLGLVGWAGALTPGGQRQALPLQGPDTTSTSAKTGRGGARQPTASTPPPKVEGRMPEGYEGGYEPGVARESRVGLLILSSIMMGWMVSVKATSLIPLFLFAVFILIQLWRDKGAGGAFKTAVLYGLLAVVIGSVWYIKSFAYTGNPFYPFAYHVVGHLFGGRYWSEPNAVVYAQSQRDFGVGHGLRNLVLIPWTLTMYLLPGHILAPGVKGYNDFQNNFTALSPIFLAALFLPAFVRIEKSRTLIWLALFALAMVVIWFFLTQQVRYLLPVAPALSILAAFILCELWPRRAFAGYALGALFAFSIAFSLFIALDGDPAWVPSQSQVAFGKVSPDAYIARYFDAYGAMQYLNTQTPPDAKAVFYGEPLGFYSDREYLWGEPGHSLLIPYDTLQTPEALRAYLTERGYHYILVNSVFAPLSPGRGWAGMVYSLTAGSGTAPVYSRGPVSIYAI